MTTQKMLEHDELSNLALEELKGLRDRLKLAQYPKITNRLHQDGYAVDLADISPELREALDDLIDARVNPYSKILCFKKKVSIETAMPEMVKIYALLGVLLKLKKVPVAELSLAHLVSFTEYKTALRRAKTYEEVRLIEQAALEAAEQTLEILTAVLNWLRKERKIHPSTEKTIILGFLTIAKFIYYKETDSLKAFNYSDIPVVLMLRQEYKEAKERARGSPAAADESLKWLDWPEFLACVHQLEQECKPVYSYGLKRKRKAIARSIQRFLLFALLSYMPPDRQRTLRELEVGKTLVKGLFNQSRIFEATENGNWYFHLMKTDYKTGKIYGEQWLMVPDILYPYLEDWLNQWRAEFSPTHDFVFTQENGKPFKKASDLSGIIRRATHRLTGKLTTSHLIRHMLITYLKRNNVSDEVMASLARAMRHSSKIQTELYDRRHQLEKVAPAQDLVLKLAMGEAVPNLLAGQALTVDELAQQIRNLVPSDRQRLFSLFKF